MLTMLYGTSCSGKSTLIKLLCDQHYFNPVNAYMTRPRRHNDFARIPVPVEIFKHMQSRGEFAIVNEHLAGSYGNLKAELELATTAQPNFILDFLIKDEPKLNGYLHTKIIVLPEGETQLIAQITEAGRESRMTEILQDYADNYNPQALKQFTIQGFHLVINVKDRPEIAVQEILNITSKK